jgi:hypothetical protein
LLSNEEEAGIDPERLIAVGFGSSSTTASANASQWRLKCCLPRSFAIHRRWLT